MGVWLPLDYDLSAYHHVRLFLCSARGGNAVLLVDRHKGPLLELPDAVAEAVRNGWRRGYEIGVGRSCSQGIELFVIPFDVNPEMLPSGKRPRLVTLAERRWAVPSRHRNGWWMVGQTLTRKFLCTCPAGRMRWQLEHPCAHVRTVATVIEMTETRAQDHGLKPWKKVNSPA